mgnify:FL=1
MKYLILVLSIILFVSCSNQKTSGSISNTGQKPVKIQLIRNATLKIEFNGKTLLIDPSLSPKNSFMSFVQPDKNLNPTVDLTIPMDDIIKDADAVLVTHTHLDHFDEGAKKHLPKETPLFGQSSDEKVFKEALFTNVMIIDSTADFGGITIHRTGGKHGPDQMLEMLGEVSGFVLEAEGSPTIYIIGDCLLDDEIKSNIEKFNPDIIVVNSGGAVFGLSLIHI